VFDGFTGVFVLTFLNTWDCRGFCQGAAARRRSGELRRGGHGGHGQGQGATEVGTETQVIFLGGTSWENH